MKTHIVVAWVLGVTGVVMFAAGLILTLAREPEPTPTSGQVSQWDAAPASRDDEIGKVVGNTVYEVPADTPPKLGPNEVVTTDPNPTPITGNFVVPYKLVFAASSGIQWNSIEDAARERGKHVITQAEAEEVVKALKILTRYSSSRWAYEPSEGADITVSGTGWFTMSGSSYDGRSEAQKLEDEAENLEASAKAKRAKAEQMKNEERDVKWAMSVLAKWRKRVEERKP